MSDTANSTGEQNNTGEPHGNPDDAGQNNGGQPNDDQGKTPSVEELTAKVEELTRESRKWETRSKENYEKAQELDRLKREQMSDDEKRQAVFDDLTKERDSERERADKAEAALARFKVAVEFGLSEEDTEALSHVSDEEAMRTLAERLAGRSSGAPRPNPHQGNRRKDAHAGPRSTADLFAETLEGLF